MVSVWTLWVSLGAALLAGRPAAATQAARGDDTIQVQVAERGMLRTRAVPTEEYVAATALSEFAPAAGDPERVAAMYEVQTIISRTYALSHRGRHRQEGFDLCATTHCQLYEPGRLTTSRWAAAVKQAVARTAGVILLYGGEPAEALYHADCGGAISAAGDVWGGATYAYLHRHKDDGPARAAHKSWRYEISADALRHALNTDPRTSVGRRLDRIRVAARDGAGRARRLLLRGDTEIAVRGTDLREVVSARLGAQAIRSTLFEVKSSGRRFVFSGRGYGHGVGLCQVGAFARLNAGAAPRTVLEHYYPGVTVTGGG